MLNTQAKAEGSTMKHTITLTESDFSANANQLGIWGSIQDMLYNKFVDQGMNWNDAAMKSKKYESITLTVSNAEGE